MPNLFHFNMSNIDLCLPHQCQCQWGLCFKGHITLVHVVFRVSKELLHLFFIFIFITLMVFYYIQIKISLLVSSSYLAVCLINDSMRNKLPKMSQLRQGMHAWAVLTPNVVQGWMPRGQAKNKGVTLTNSNIPHMEGTPPNAREQRQKLYVVHNVYWFNYSSQLTRD